MDTIMSWNRPDIAKKYVLLTGTEIEVFSKYFIKDKKRNVWINLLFLSKKQILEEKMFEALAQDKVDFVQLLLEYGVNLNKFLTFKRLQDLYNAVILALP